MRPSLVLVPHFVFSRNALLELIGSPYTNYLCCLHPISFHFEIHALRTPLRDVVTYFLFQSMQSFKLPITTLLPSVSPFVRYHPL